VLKNTNKEKFLNAKPAKSKVETIVFKQINNIKTI